MQRPHVARIGASTAGNEARSAVVWRPETQTANRRWAPTIVSVGLIGWWVAQLAQVLIGSHDQTPTTAATTATAEGSLFNTGIILAFASLGVWFWPWSVRLPKSAAVRLLMAATAAYLIWALASLTWSVDLGLSIRRYVQLAMILIGCVGLGAGFYARAPDGETLFALHVLWAGLIGVAVMWAAVLLVGDLNVFSPTWAAKDIGVGTRIGYPIAYALLAGVYLGHTRVIRGWRLAAVIGVLLFSLLLQKARFTIAFGLVCMALLVLRGTRWSMRWTLVLVGVGILAWVVAVMVAVNGAHPIEPVLNGIYTYATLDTTSETTTSLTGRTSLWDALYAYLQERPWTGYGFGAFWNPEFLAQIWSIIPWHPPVAHDGFLDEVLGTGLIGSALLLLAWGMGTLIAIRRSDYFGALVALGMVLFLLLNVGDSIMQSYFQFPFYAAVAGLATLLGRGAQERRAARVQAR
jgi:exopolysaccharide production protein ExoQ